MGSPLKEGKVRLKVDKYHSLIKDRPSQAQFRLSKKSVKLTVNKCHPQSSRGGLVRKGVSFSFSKFCTFCELRSGNTLSQFKLQGAGGSNE